MENESISALRKQLQDAISKCDFIRAKNIDLQIKRLAETNKKNVTINKNQINAQNYELAKEDVRYNVTKCLEEAQKQATSQRDLYQCKIIEIEKEYSQNIAELNDIYASQMDLCTNRVVPEAMVLQKEAKAMAKIQDYDNAAALFTISVDLANKTTEERQAEVTRQYEVNKSRILERKESEKYSAKVTLLQNLQDIQRHYSNDMDRLRKNLATAAFKFKAKQTPDEEEMYLPIEFEELKSFEYNSKPTPKAAKNGLPSRPASRTPSRPSSRNSPRSPRSSPCDSAGSGSRSLKRPKTPV